MGMVLVSRKYTGAVRLRRGDVEEPASGYATHIVLSGYGVSAL